MSTRIRLLCVAAIAALMASACGNPNTTGLPESSNSAAPTGQQFHEFPLAVVTGYTSPTRSITSEQLSNMNDLLIPCGLDTVKPRLTSTTCLPAQSIVAQLAQFPQKVGLLPSGLIEPKVKVLPVDKTDLFGGPETRSADYPVKATSAALPASWTMYNSSAINRVVSVGDICQARGVAYQAIKEKRGWDWPYDGGTVKYNKIVPNPAPAGQPGYGERIVDASPQGNNGAVADLLRGGDATVAHFPCPISDDNDVDDTVPFTVPSAAIKPMSAKFGIDLVNLASPHALGAGSAGVAKTLKTLKDAKIETVGVGTNLDEALTHRTINIHGTVFAFVGFNAIPPSAGGNSASTAAMASLIPAHVRTSLSKIGQQANVVICMPQWWGESEYHSDLQASQVEQQKLLLQSGCDHILGSGTHWAGPVEMSADYSGVHLTVGSQGNFMFGQEWSQETSEGIIVEMVFVGSKLVQVRWHPYFEYKQGQPNLIDPAGDGAELMKRVFRTSSVNYSQPK